MKATKAVKKEASQVPTAKRQQEMVSLAKAIMNNKKRGIVHIIEYSETESRGKTEGMLIARHVPRNIQLKLLINAFEIEPREILLAAIS